MRDKRRDEKYFRKYLAYQAERIRKKEIKLKEAEGDSEKQQRIYVSLMNYKMDQIFAEFSSGADESRLKSLLSDAMITACGMDVLNYETLMNLLSLAIFLKYSEGTVSLAKLLDKHSECIRKDKLLNLFSCYLKGDDLRWTGTLVNQKVFGKLDDILGNDAEKVLAEYLESWYDCRQEMSWYDSHKGNNETYVGYWSFEAAALAKIFEVNEDVLAGYEYFPVM